MNKNKKNVVFSILSQLIIMTLGFIVPRIIMNNYGSDVNGVLSTITQVFSYVALLEAGIGRATRNQLYKYVKPDQYDRNGISKVMVISRNYYRKCTYIYALIVIVMAFVLPLILKSDVAHMTITFIVLFEGMTGVVSFYFVQSWNCLLAADGRNYVITNIEFISRIICYGIKIWLTLLNVNLVYIEVGYFVVSLVKLFIYKIYMDRNYGWLDYSVSSDNEKLPDRGSYLITEIAWTIFSSTDMIVLSVFVSTSLSSVYTVYNMIFVAINSFVNGLYDGLKFNLGQAYHTSLKDYKDTHDNFNTLFVGIITILLSIAYVMILPFITLYTQGVSDVDYIQNELPICFCLIQLLSWSRMVAGNLSGLAGYAKQIGKISLIEALINVFASVILVHYFSITGVLIATVISLPIKVIYCNYLADKIVMNRKTSRTIRILGANWVFFGGVVCVARYMKLSINNFYQWAAYALLVGLVVGVLGVTVNLTANKQIINHLKLKKRKEGK